MQLGKKVVEHLEIRDLPGRLSDFLFFHLPTERLHLTRKPAVSTPNVQQSQLPIFSRFHVVQNVTRFPDVAFFMIRALNFNLVVKHLRIVPVQHLQLRPRIEISKATLTAAHNGKHFIRMETNLRHLIKCFGIIGAAQITAHPLK